MPLNGQINTTANASETLDLFGTVSSSLNGQKDVAINGQNHAYIQTTAHINYTQPQGLWRQPTIGLTGTKDVALFADGEMLVTKVLTADLDTITMDNINITTDQNRE